MPNLSATVTIPLAIVPAEYHIIAQVTVSNSSGHVINVTQIVPRIKKTGSPHNEDASSRCKASVRVDIPEIPAGGSQRYLMELVFHGSSNGGTYDIGADVYSLEGELINPAPVTVSVLQNPNP